MKTSEKKKSARHTRTTTTTTHQVTIMNQPTYSARSSSGAATGATDFNACAINCADVRPINFVNSLGQTTQLQFDNVVNRVANTVFEFKVPEGADVMRGQ